MLYQHAHTTPAPPSQWAPGVPPSLEALSMKLLEKRPQDRLGYAVDVSRALAPHLTRAATAKPRGAGYVYRSPLVGRDAVLRRLTSVIADLAEGAGAFVALRGESGSGKTRLAMEVIGAVSRRPVFVVARSAAPFSDAPGSAGTPLAALQPLFQAIADWYRDRPGDEVQRRFGAALSLLAPHVPALASLASLAPSPSSPVAEVLGASGARRRLLDAVIQVVEAVADELPVLLVLDDLQWADELSVDALCRLAESDVRSRPIAVIALWRTEEEGDVLGRLARLPSVECHAVERLDGAGVARMIAGMLALDETPAPLHAMILARSDGTPLFVAEYLRTAMAEGLLRRTEEGSWALDVPEGASLREVAEPTTVRALIARRLGSLDGEAAFAATCGAVIGRSFDEELLGLVLGVDEMRRMDVVETLRRRAVIETVTGAKLQFVHDQIRDAILSRSRAPRLRALHRRVAEAIEAREADRDEAQAALGRHWFEAEEFPRAARAFERAGHVAGMAYANAEAIECLQRALDALDASPVELRSPDRRAAVAEALGDVCDRVGRYEEARKAFTQVLDVLPSAHGVDRTRVLRKRAKTWEIAHQHVAALRDYDEAIAALSDAPGAGEEALWRHEGNTTPLERVWAHYWLAQVDAMAALVERVRPAAEAHEAAALRSRFYQAMAHQDLRRGRYLIEPETVALAREAARLAAQLPEIPLRAAAWFPLGFVLTFSGAPTEGAAALEEARSTARRVGDVTMELRAVAYLAVAHRFAGDVDATRSLAEASLALARRLAMNDYVGVALANLGWTHWRCGDPAQARTTFVAALAAWDALGEQYTYPMQWLGRLPMVALCADEGDALGVREQAIVMLGPLQHLLPERLTAALDGVAGARPHSASDASAVLEAARGCGYL